MIGLVIVVIIISKIFGNNDTSTNVTTSQNIQGFESVVDHALSSALNFTDSMDFSGFSGPDDPILLNGINLVSSQFIPQGLTDEQRQEWLGTFRSAVLEVFSA
jgi:hypothetical protein